MEKSTFIIGVILLGVFVSVNSLQCYECMDCADNTLNDTMLVTCGTSDPTTTPTAPVDPTTVPTTSGPIDTGTTAPTTSGSVNPGTTVPATSGPVDPGTTAPTTSPPVDLDTTAPTTSPPVDPGTTAPTTSPPVDPGTTAPTTSPPVDLGTTAPTTSPPVDPGTTAPTTSPPVDPGTTAPTTSPPVDLGTTAPTTSPPVDLGTTAPTTSPPVDLGTISSMTDVLQATRVRRHVLPEIVELDGGCTCGGEKCACDKGVDVLWPFQYADETNITYVCAKVARKENGTDIIYRGCAVPKVGEQEFCEYLGTAVNATADTGSCRTCSTDKCNSAYSLQNSIAVLLLVITLALFTK